MLDVAHISDLLQPFLGGAPVSPQLLAQLQRYLSLLLRWNARMNLTAVRAPEQIVTRHFGESLYAAKYLQEAGAFGPVPTPTLSDVGAGAGFPGIPIKLFFPHLRLTLIEAQAKKAAFLREVIRLLDLADVEVYCGRAETWGHGADVVTLRAVEKFHQVLPTVCRLVNPRGTICLLIGQDQLPQAQEIAGTEWMWSRESLVPGSEGRMVVSGKKIQANAQDA